MKTVIIIIFSLLCLGVQAQDIIVVNSSSDEPIVNVVLYNKSKDTYAVTDVNGKVNIGSFNSDEFIYFQSISYKTLKLKKSEIINSGNRVRLEIHSQVMNPVVLSASKFQQRKQNIPQKIFAVQRDEVIVNNPQTSADLLQQSGKVFVQKSQQGGGSPMIRGFSTNRLLLTVDGVRMNTAIFRSGNLQNVISIDPLSVDRTEVILGPGSVVYGSDAIGGVMNFYTINPRFNKDSIAISGNALLRYATANNENTAHVDLNIGSRKWAAATSISLNFFDDLRMGAHGPDEYLRSQYVVRRDNMDVLIENDDHLIQRPTGYDQLNLLQKFRYQPQQDLELGLSLIYTATSDVPRYDALTRFRESGNPRNARWFYGPQTWLMTNFNLTHRGNGKWYDRVRFTQAYQQFNESRNVRDFQEPELFVNEERVDVISSNLDFERRNRENNVLNYGVEFVHNRVYSIGGVTDIDTGESVAAATRYPDGSSWRTLATYLNYQWKPKEQLALNTGLRYNHVWSDASFDNEFFDFPFTRSTFNTGALTGALGAVYATNDNWEIRSNLSTAFRAPNIDDKGKIFDPNPGTIIVPNPDLDSEYAYTAELGVKKRFNEKLLIDVSGYYTLLQDALVTRDFNLNGQEFVDYQGRLSRVQAVQNAEEAMVYGLELGLLYELNKYWKFHGNYSWISGEQKDDSGDVTPIRHVSPSFGDAHMMYTKENWFLDAFVVFNGQLNADEIAPSLQARPHLFALDENGSPFSPSWYTLNVRASYSFNTHLKVNAALENITDQRYRTYSSGITAAGRNFIISLNYSF